MIDIFKTIRDERQDFLNNEVEVVPGYNFSQYSTIKKIHLYHNSRYEKGDYEEINGVMRKKIFHNMSAWRCEVATKMIDIDVKDFQLISNKPEQDFFVWLLEKELKVWLKKHEMGQLLNEISEYLPVYGSVVLEKTSDGAELVDLRYLYNDQSARTLKDGSYTNRLKYLSHETLRKMKKKGWQDVDYAIDNLSSYYTMGYDDDGIQTANGGSSLYTDGASTEKKAQGVPVVETWFRVGEVPKSWLEDKEPKEGEEEEYVLAKFVVAGIDKYTKNDEGVILEEDGRVLWKEEIKPDEFPFKEVHYRKTPGRWLGIGIVEALFENQRRMNEVKNHQARALEFASVQLFQTRDSTAPSNILTDVENGEILYTKQEITPIATESRENAGFVEVMQDLENHSDNLTFSRDVVSGEQPPSSTTLGAVQIATQQTTAVFDYKKENIGLFLSAFIKDLVFPQLESELNKEHVLRLTGSMDELMRLRNNFATNCANRKIIDLALGDNDVDITPELYAQYHQEALLAIGKQGDKIWLEVMKNSFDNLDYDVDIVITGENRNLQAQVANGTALIQAIGSDPSLLQDPVKKKLIFKVMSAMGFHISELEDVESALQQNNQQENNGNPQIPGMQPLQPQQVTPTMQ